MSDLVLEPGEVAFWQAVYTASVSVQADAACAVRADEAVRRLRARLLKPNRGILRMQGGPGPAGIDPPKDA